MRDDKHCLQSRPHHNSLRGVVVLDVPWSLVCGVEEVCIAKF